MKKTIYFLFLIFMTGFISCQSEDIIDNSATTKTTDLHQDKSIIEQLGFDVSTLVDKGDYYLVEGDISLIKENLKQHLDEFKGNVDKSKLKQGYKSGRLVSLTNVKNMTIRIDGTLPTSGTGSDWRSAVMTAINAWNNISGSCVNFVYTTATTADITVRRAYSSDGEYARVSDFPLNQKPSKEIIVNSMHDNFAYKANTIIHEMGHSIGFLHTHYTPAQQGGVLIPGTPTIDDTSIMSYNRNRTLLPGFSNYDLIAVRYLYPAEVPTPVLTLYIPPMNPSDIGRIYNQTASCNLAGTLTYTWSSDGNRATILSGQGTSTVRLQINAVPMQLSLRVTSSTGQYRDMDYYDSEGGEIKIY